MELITAFLILITLLFLYFSQQIVEKLRFLIRVNKLPTSRPNPIFGHLFNLIGPRNQLMQVILDLSFNGHEMFTMWMGPVPMFCITEPKHHEILLGSPKYIFKEVPYEFLKPWLGDGLLNSSGQKWHTRRKMLTPSFHFTILDNYVEVFGEKSRVLVKKLEKEIGSQRFDVFPYINLCALDIICETAMGTDMKAQEEGEHSAYVTAVGDISHDIMQRTLTPWLHPDFIFNLSAPGRRSKKNLEILHNFTNQVIKDRKRVYKLERERKKSLTEDDGIGKKKRLNFLDLLLECAEKENKLTDVDIREEVDTFMFEGHDTTTMGICWSLQMLATHPDIQEKVYEEIDSVLSGPDHTPKMKELNEMKYLERVIKESLRLYPSVPMFGRQLLEDVEIDGYTLPAGLRVVFLPISTHRHPGHWEDPLTFNPDNFLPEKVAERHPYAYIPFSAGPRNCIGQKFALLEEKMVISSIVRNYKIEAAGEVPVGLPDLILRPENGIHLRIVPRNH